MIVNFHVLRIYVITSVWHIFEVLLIRPVTRELQQLVFSLISLFTMSNSQFSFFVNCISKYWSLSSLHFCP